MSVNPVGVWSFSGGFPSSCPPGVDDAVWRAFGHMFAVEYDAENDLLDRDIVLMHVRRAMELLSPMIVGSGPSAAGGAL